MPLARTSLSVPAPSTIAALVIAIFWTIPTFGLFVTSLRPGSDVQSTGWWTVFTDPSAGDQLRDAVLTAARRCIAQGAEVIICPGPSTALMASRGIFECDGVPLLDSYSLLVKMAEAAVAMHRITGVAVSRKGLYQSPPTDLVKKAAAIHDIGPLKNG